MNNVLIDTNVLIYAKDRSSVFHHWSVEVISENNCFITSKNLSEYYAVVTRGEDSVLTQEEALQDILEFSKRFVVLFPDLYSLRHLFSLTEKYHPRGLKFHDFEIAAIAIANKIRKLATVNKDDFIELKEIELIFTNLKKSK